MIHCPSQNMATICQTLKTHCPNSLFRALRRATKTYRFIKGLETQNRHVFSPIDQPYSREILLNLAHKMNCITTNELHHYK